MPDVSSPPRRAAARFFSEPLVHFFALGALLFLAHHLLVGDARTIRITPGLEAELTRRFQDQNGRKPDAAEQAAALRNWERDEALFREALREHRDRDDPGVRAALIDKMHGLAAFEVPKREPTDADLQSWLTAHRSQYEDPRRFDFELVVFQKSEPSADAQRDKFAHALNTGVNASTLGRPIIGGELTLAELKDRLEPELAARLPVIPVGPWQRLEGSQSLWLVRVKQVTGGLPPVEELRPRLVADWSFATRKEATERILQRTVDRYRFEHSR